MTARQVVLWRHGQTDWNVTGQYQGHIDIPLNRQGREQAVAAALRLAQMQPTSIFSSDLSRAVETAVALGAAVELPVATDPRLREINVGSWGGLTTDQMAAVDAAYLTAMRDGHDYRRSSSGETAGETGVRVATVVDEIGRTAADDEVVVLVSHGLAIRQGIARLLGLSYEQALVLGGVHNCAWCVLGRARTGGWRLEQYNVTAQPSLDRQPERGEWAT